MNSLLGSRRMLALVLAWVLSLVGAAAVGTAWAQRLKPDPLVLSGADIGFRVDHMGRKDVAMGALVVRIDGKWVDAQFSGVVRPGR